LFNGMSDDESLATIVAGIVALTAWISFWMQILGTKVGGRAALRGWLGWMPVWMGVVIFTGLKLWSASDVRNAPQYLFMYTMMGLAWVGVSLEALALVDLRIKDDVGMKNNRAGSLAVLGAGAGLAMAFTGANFGEGPGWWVVVASGLTATLGVLAAVWVTNLVTGIVDAVTIERDEGAGARLGLLFVGLGLIAGRAAAGNWTGMEGMLADFAKVGWGMVWLVVLEICYTRLLFPPHSGRVVSKHGVLPGLGHVVLAVLHVWGAGPW
jgi:hypothetical protein